MVVGIGDAGMVVVVWPGVHGTDTGEAGVERDEMLGAGMQGTGMG